jgi:hypothetical protein
MAKGRELIEMRLLLHAAEADHGWKILSFSYDFF